MMTVNLSVIMHYMPFQVMSWLGSSQTRSTCHMMGMLLIRRFEMQSCMQCLHDKVKADNYMNLQRLSSFT